MSVIKNMVLRAGADFSSITHESKKASASMEKMTKSVSVASGGLNMSLGKIKKAFGALGAVISVRAIVGAAKDAAAAYDSQVEAEARLAQVMRTTMDATDDEIDSVKELTAAQQQLGIVGDEVQLAGAQELATYLGETASLKKLIPVMNDMVAQQYGYTASAEQATNIATMLGKVMEGQTGGLSRYGYYFDDAQKKILKYGTEAQRAAVLADIVESSVGGMNYALAQTPTGRMKQLSNTLGDIKENFGQAVRTIGTAFLPVLTKLANMLAAVANFANRVAQAIANVFGGKVNLVKSAAPAAAAVGGIAESYDDVAEAAGGAAKAAKAVTADIDTLHFLNNTQDSSGSGSSASEDAGGAAVGGIGDAATESYESIGILENALTKLRDFGSSIDFTPLQSSFDTLREKIQPLVDVISNGLSWAMENVLAPLGKWTIEEALPTTVEALASSFELLGTVLGKLQTPFQYVMENIFKPFGENIRKNIILNLDEFTFKLDLLNALLKGDIGLSDFFYVWKSGGAYFNNARLDNSVEAFRTVVENLSGSLGRTKDSADKAGSSLFNFGGKAEDSAGSVDTATDSILTMESTSQTSTGKIVSAWENVRFAIHAFNPVLGAVGDAIVSKLSKNFQNAGQDGSKAYDKVKNTWSASPSWFAQTGDSIFSKFSSKVQQIVSKMQTIASQVRSSLSSMNSNVSSSTSSASSMLERLRSTAASVASYVSNALSSAGSWISSKVSSISLPHLAQGAVIPPNSQFAAILGDQTHGYNIETPENLLRQIFREEAGAGNEEIISMLGGILSAVRAGKVIEIDKRELGRTVQSTLADQRRSYGMA